MKKMKFFVWNVWLCSIACFTGIQTTFAQDSSAAAMSVDAAMSALQALPPAQLEALLNMAINSLPPERKASIEESLTTMKSVNPEIKTVRLKDKEVSFIPLAHASTPEFYQKVKAIVKQYKADNYVVYYEQVNSDDRPLQDEVDTLRLKLRKIVGLEPNRQAYAMLKKFFPNVISQPEYKDLGITATDVNADVRLEQLIHRYEELYGPVNLTDCDFNTKLGSLYSCGKLDNKLDPVVLEYRNKFVADLIRSSRDKKILVLYGARHIPGISALIENQ